jgi:16S rRNA (uracil1498-N3)-methyltransferase
VTQWALADRGIWKLATFRVAPGSIDGDSLVLREAEGHHAADVVRLRAGDAARLIDGVGAEAVAVVERVARSAVHVRVVERRTHDRASATELTVFQSLLKGRSFDEVVRRCAELGVAKIVPMSTERSIGRLPDADVDRRLSRWRGIALAAVKQARGVFLPEIARPVEIEEAAELIVGSDLAIIAWEEEVEIGLSRALEAHRRGSLALLVGPEGGFAAAEVDSLVVAGGRPVSVGRRVLRADWAAAAIAAMISFEVGGLLP